MPKFLQDDVAWRYFDESGSIYRQSSAPNLLDTINPSFKAWTVCNGPAESHIEPASFDKWRQQQEPFIKREVFNKSLAAPVEVYALREGAD